GPIPGRVDTQQRPRATAPTVSAESGREITLWPIAPVPTPADSPYRPLQQPFSYVLRSALQYPPRKWFLGRDSSLQRPNLASRELRIATTNLRFRQCWFKGTDLRERSCEAPVGIVSILCVGSYIAETTRFRRDAKPWLANGGCGFVPMRAWNYSKLL